MATGAPFMSDSLSKSVLEDDNLSPCWKMTTRLYFCDISSAANAGWTPGFDPLTRGCVTDHAAQDGASENMVGEMAGDIAGNCAFDATFGNG
jgi:hypothetical protein